MLNDSKRLVVKASHVEALHPMGSVPQVILNRPFVYAIIDNNKLPLFMEIWFRDDIMVKICVY